MNDSDEYKILTKEINELHKRLDGHDKYLKEMTYALAFVSVLVRCSENYMWWREWDSYKSLKPLSKSIYKILT